MIDTGTLMGKAILKGMGVALKEGVGVLGTLWGDVEKIDKKMVHSVKRPVDHL